MPRSLNQDHEFRVFGFVNDRLRRGFIIGVFSLQTIAIIWLFISNDRNNARHSEAEAILRREYKESEQTLRTSLIICKDDLARKVEELENRQILMLKELYHANARLEQVQRRR